MRTDATDAHGGRQSTVIRLRKPGMRARGITVGPVCVLFGLLELKGFDILQFKFAPNGAADYFDAIPLLFAGLVGLVWAPYIGVRLDGRGLTEYFRWPPKRVRWDEVDSVRVGRLTGASLYAPILLLHDGTELPLKSLRQAATRDGLPRARVQRQTDMIRTRLDRNDEPHAP